MTRPVLTLIANQQVGNESHVQLLTFFKKQRIIVWWFPSFLPSFFIDPKLEETKFLDRVLGREAESGTTERLQFHFWPLVWEDPTCHEAAKPVQHSFSLPAATAETRARLEPGFHNRSSQCTENPAQLERACTAATTQATKTSYTHRLTRLFQPEFWLSITYRDHNFLGESQWVAECILQFCIMSNVRYIWKLFLEGFI